MKRLLYISTVWPETRASAAGVRSFQMLKYLSKYVFDEVACASISKETTYKSEMESIANTEAFSVPCKPNDSTFDEELKKFDPDVVIFERFMLEEMFGWRVRKTLPNAMRVLDTQDLHFVRRFREREVTKLRPGEFNAQNLRDIKVSGSKDEFMLREIASIVRCDATLLVSTFELDLLRNKFPFVSQSKLHIAPFFYNPIQSESFRSLERRKPWSAMTIGTFRHAPNVDSVYFLRDDIAPLTERVKYKVYGAYPSREHMKMSTNSDRFRVMGPAVESAQKCISRHRILIAPLRFGAGIKGKIADSWRSGTPVVTTPIGAEGMGWQWDVDDNACWGGLVADDADGIANCVNRLMCDDNLWVRCQSKGHQLLKEMFDFETQGRSL